MGFRVEGLGFGVSGGIWGFWTDSDLEGLRLPTGLAGSEVGVDSVVVKGVI